MDCSCSSVIECFLRSVQPWIQLLKPRLWIYKLYTFNHLFNMHTYCVMITTVKWVNISITTPLTCVHGCEHACVHACVLLICADLQVSNKPNTTDQCQYIRYPELISSHNWMFVPIDNTFSFFLLSNPRHTMFIWGWSFISK